MEVAIRKAPMIKVQGNRTGRIRISYRSKAVQEASGYGWSKVPHWEEARECAVLPVARKLLL